MNTNCFCKFCLVIGLTLLTSCAPIMGLQDGRTLGKGDASFMPYIHAGAISFPTDDTTPLSSSLPAAGCQAMLGVSERLDVGMKIDLNSFTVATTKYQFLGDRQSRFAASVGGEAGVLFGGILLGGFFTYLSAPVYLSWHPSEKVSFYVQGRVTRTNKTVVKNANGNGQDRYSYSQILSGFSYGASYGAKNKLFIEIGHYHHQLYRPTQVSLGFAVRERIKVK